MAHYSKEWEKRKKFGAQALRASGFGTRASENKLLVEVTELMAFVEQKQGSPIDISQPIFLTMTNMITSVLLNERNKWESPEIKRVLQACRDWMTSLILSIRLSLISSATPVPLSWLKYLMPSEVRKIQDLASGLRNYIQEKIVEHRETFDPSEMRDFLDIYIRDRTEEDFSDKVFVSMSTVFFPDGITTAGDTLMWAILYLAHHPEFQKLAQEQIDQVG